jgi:hypothetical protein
MQAAVARGRRVRAATKARRRSRRRPVPTAVASSVISLTTIRSTGGDGGSPRPRTHPTCSPTISHVPVRTPWSALQAAGPSRVHRAVAASRRRSGVLGVPAHQASPYGYVRRLSPDSSSGRRGRATRVPDREASRAPLRSRSVSREPSTCARANPAHGRGHLSTLELLVEGRQIDAGVKCVSCPRVWGRASGSGQSPDPRFGPGWG